MRHIDSAVVIHQVAQAVVDINLTIDPSILAFYKKQLPTLSGRERTVVEILLENAKIAGSRKIPLCQDTGLIVVFAKVGLKVCFDRPLQDLVNEGVRHGTSEGYLRKSIVEDPLFARKNTSDNSPAVLHIELVEGNQLEMDIMAKGGGSENASAIRMMTPAEGREGIVQFAVDQVNAKGVNACPPLIIGIGIGGDMERCAMLAKQALMRTIGQRHAMPEYASLEREILEKINQLNIGPGGYGGRLTAMDVFIEHAPCHIASMPVCVNIGCNSTRHGRVVI